MYKITKAIEKVIEDIKQTGNGSVKIDDILSIEGSWEMWDEDEDHDIITIYIYERDIIAFRYQVVETLIKSE